MPIPPTMDELLNDLIERVDRGDLAPGSQIPSGRELADHYGVSHSKIQRAVAQLRERGILVGRPGRGVYVAEDRPKR